jgi:uncharacterized protein with FMN-binding domain
MGITLLMGRWFCGWLCAFGSYNDLIYFLSRKVFKSKFRINEKVDNILKYVKYVVLIFIVIVSWTMGSSILESVSPWDAFGQITDISTIFSSLLIGLILLVLITIGAAFVERFFCRYLCPLGAVFSIISKIGIVKINKPKAECDKCRACAMNCSMGLDLYKVNGARGGECINCLKCTEVCHRNNANVNILGQDVNQNLAGSVAMATMLGVYGITNFGANTLTNSGMISNQAEVSSSIASSSTSQNYKDGTYTGSGQGFHGGTTKVSVTIADGKITKMEILSNGDTPQYFERVSGTITKEILSKQSTSVDTISGATYSSKGIISAVKDALSQATDSSSDTASNTNGNETRSATKEETATTSATENSKTTKTTNTTEATKSAEQSTKANESTGTTSAPSSSAAKSGTTASNNQTSTSSNTQTTTSKASQSATSSSSTSSSQGAYKDGTYAGSGTGFKGRTTKVSVTVANGKISNIETLSYGDDRSYFERALSSVTKSIISKQSTSVDTVSGATYSSKGIMSAVANALTQAK